MKPHFLPCFIALFAFFGMQPAPAQLKRVVDASSILPSASPTNFLDFIQDEVASVSLDKGKIAFMAKDASQINGIYVAQDTNIAKVVRSDDIEPVSGGPYGQFVDQRIRDGKVAFSTDAAGVINRGVYLWDGSTITNIANTNTPMPGGAVGEKFTSFSSVDVDGGRVVFRGGSDQSGGVYLWNGSSLQ